MDPLTERFALSVTSDEVGEPFMELVDVDLVEGTVWAVGQGGLLVADLGADGTLTERHRDLGMGRYHRVELLDVGALALVHRDIGLVLRNAADPVTTTASKLAGGMEGLAGVGERLYVADRTAGLAVYRVEALDELDAVGVVEGPDATWELHAGEGVLYAADNELGLAAWSLADPDAPTYLGGLSTPGLALDLDVEAGFLYLARGAAGIEVYDLADPLAPVLVHTVSVGGSAVSVAASEGWLWAAEHDAVAAWSLADPSAPTPLGRQATRQFALAIDAEGAHAVVGDWGYLESWGVDAAGSAPALDLDRSAFPAGTGEASLTLTNRGGGDLELRGGEAEGGEVWASSATVAPGATATLTVRWNGAAPTSVCVATNDPDAPTLILPVGPAPEPPIGDPAPDFTLPTLDGDTVRLSEQLGHPVVLAYFATW